MEFFVDLLPKDQWRPVFHQDKDRLIAAMDRELGKIPGVFWGFSQPISDRPRFKIDCVNIVSNVTTQEWCENNPQLLTAFAKADLEHRQS